MRDLLQAFLTCFIITRSIQVYTKYVKIVLWLYDSDIGG